ncbi:nucleoside deaminase [Streptomyces sp. NPDC046821]|uniref:nucleoside deaminase n=1 Tax=Streptomyces sp. NPDC046821 TaxID=3154702 RepID=UPI003406591C
MPDEHANHMREALAEAHLAGARGDLAVGAVVVHSGRVVARGGNEATSTNDQFAHAEIVALREFERLHPGTPPEEATLYSTFEPCPMCLGACLVARIGAVVVGGRRRLDDRAWGAYRPEHLAAVVKSGGPALRLETGPFGDECVALRTKSLSGVPISATADLKEQA